MCDKKSEGIIKAVGGKVIFYFQVVLVSFNVNQLSVAKNKLILEYKVKILIEADCQLSFHKAGRIAYGLKKKRSKIALMKWRRRKLYRRLTALWMQALL